ERAGPQSMETRRRSGPRSLAGTQREVDRGETERGRKDLRSPPDVQHRFRLQRMQQEEGGPGEGRRVRAGRALQKKVEQGAADEVKQKAGDAEAAGPHAPEIGVEEEGGEEDRTRLVRRIAV